MRILSIRNARRFIYVVPATLLALIIIGRRFGPSEADIQQHQKESEEAYEKAMLNYQVMMKKRQERQQREHTGSDDQSSTEEPA